VCIVVENIALLAGGREKFSAHPVFSPEVIDSGDPFSVFHSDYYNSKAVRF